MSPVHRALAVVVVTHSSGDTLAECVARALASADVGELAVIDNASADGSIDALEARFGGDPRLRVQRNPDNRGFAQACNQGAALTRAPHLMFLNPDCLLEPDSVAKLLDVASRHPEAGVIGADVRDRAGLPESAARRRDPTPWRSLTTALGLDRLAGRWPALAGVAVPPPHAAREITRVDATSGALMLVPRTVFERVGGFDPGYPLHAEDLDLCRRVRDAGMRVACVNTIRVTHGKGGSSRHRPLFVARHKHRGMWRWFVKFDPAARNPLLRTAVWIGLWLHFAALLPINAWRQARAGAQR